MASAASAAAAPSVRRWYILSLLTLAMCISFADRYVLAMLVQPIKADLHLSDSAISILNGFAFSMFYAVFGLLTARIADRGRARPVILVSLLVWSAMTAACGLARNFAQLLVVRFGVGAGEAGVSPASHAIITELFPTAQRATALALFNAGGALGILAAFGCSGILEAHYGWRQTFFIMGCPGVILALVMQLSIGDVAAPRAASRSAPRGLWHDAITLLHQRGFRRLLFALSAVAFLAFGQTQWLPAYLERAFGASRSAIGGRLALTQGGGLLLGLIAGGLLSDWLGQHDARWRLRVITVSMIGAIPFALGTYLAPTLDAACVCAGIAGFLIAVPGGPLWSAVQDELAPDARASGAATVMMISGLLALGAGPLVIGVLSDALTPSFGRGSLGVALIATIAACSAAIVVILTGLARGARDRRSISG